MNGRALNEKAVEVSPSSSRVLDRAAEILTPFPPSKNRPRPGDWTCPSCGFSNFQRRTACFRCSFAAVGGGPSGDAMGYSGYGGGGGGAGGYGGAPHMMGQQHHHMNHHGGHSGMGGGGHGRGMGGGGGMVPFRAGDWKCGNEGCGYHNFAKNVHCLRCNASRAGAAVVADSSFNQQPMEQQSSGYAMGPPPPMGNPPPGTFPPAPGYGSGAFGGSNYGGPSSYAVGGPSAAPWGPMPGTSAYPPSNSGHSGGFDSRAAEAAFASAGNAPPTTHSTGASTYGTSYGGGGLDSNADPFAFLNSGMGNLNVSDDSRRNGANSNKSPN